MHFCNCCSGWMKTFLEQDPAFSIGIGASALLFWMFWMLTTWSKGGVWFLLVWSHNQVDGFRGECFVGGVEGGGGGGGEGGGGWRREHRVAERKILASVKVWSSCNYQNTWKKVDGSRPPSGHPGHSWTFCQFAQVFKLIDSAHMVGWGWQKNIKNLLRLEEKKHKRGW